MKTQFGFHVIKVEDRRVAQPKTFDEAKGELRQELGRQAAEAKLKELKDKAKIEAFNLDGSPIPDAAAPAATPAGAPAAAAAPGNPGQAVRPSGPSVRIAAGGRSRPNSRQARTHADTQVSPLAPAAFPRSRRSRASGWAPSIAASAISRGTT